MKARLATPKDETAWLHLTGAKAGATFQQTPAWVKVLRQDGINAAGFVVERGQTLVAVGVAALYAPAPTLSYIYVPNGPIIDSNLRAPDQIEALEVFTRAVKAHWLRAKPMSLKLDPWAPLSLKKPWRHFRLGAGSAVQAPSLSAILELEPNEARLLANMHQKTRYNIKRALKGALDIDIGATPRHFEAFWALHQETATRAGFKPHPKAHYKNILAAFNQEAKIILASHDSHVLAALLLIFWGQRASYVHGGSSRAQKSLMAPYAAHWHGIVAAKKAGLKLYDFGGVSLDSKSSWAGITRFKTGFGAKIEENENVYEQIFNPSKVMALNGLRKLRRLIGG